MPAEPTGHPARRPGQVSVAELFSQLRALHLTGVDLRSTLQNPQVRLGSSTCHADSGGRALTCAAPVKWRPPSQLFPDGVQMTGELFADLEQWARLTSELATGGNGMAR